MPSGQNDIGVYSNKFAPRNIGFVQVAIPAAPSWVNLPAIPGIVDVLLIQPDADVRFIDNGNDSPDASTGILIPAGTPFQYQVTDFGLIRFTGVGGAATLNVLAYSYLTANEVP